MPRKHDPVPPDPSPRRRLLADQQFFEDLEYWIATDLKVALRLMRIIRETLRNPRSGIGKPEVMKPRYRGCFSKRLTDEDRVVYRVSDEAIDFLSARGHYD